MLPTQMDFLHPCLISFFSHEPKFSHLQKKKIIFLNMICEKNNDLLKKISFTIQTWHTSQLFLFSFEPIFEAKVRNKQPTKLFAINSYMGLPLLLCIICPPFIFNGFKIWNSFSIQIILLGCSLMPYLIHLDHISAWDMQKW